MSLWVQSGTYHNAKRAANVSQAAACPQVVLDEMHLRPDGFAAQASLFTHIQRLNCKQHNLCVKSTDANSTIGEQLPNASKSWQ